MTSHATMRFVTRWCAIGAMLLACSVLLGWLLSWTWLTAWSGPVSMVPMSALCVFAVAGGEMLRWRPGTWREALAAGITTTVVVITVGLLLDQPPLLAPVAAGVGQATGRMAYSTAVSLLLLLIAQWWRRAHWISLGMLWAIVGLAFAVPGVFGEDRWMAWPTMAALVGLSMSSRYWLGEAALPHD